MSEVIRNRFLELCMHLKEKANVLGFRVEQFDSEVDTISIAHGGAKETESGWHFANFEYRGVIYIERLPADKVSLLALSVKAWLDDNDDLRDEYKLAAPQMEIIKLDKKTLVDVIINTNFIDEIFLTETEDGPVTWRGQTFDVAPYLVDYAENAEVNNAPA